MVRSGSVSIDPFAEDRRRECAGVQAVVEAVRSDDPDGLMAGLARAQDEAVIRSSLRAISRLPGAGAAIRDAFPSIWFEYGDTLRSECENDLILIAALKVLLPTYDGPELLLYRGDMMASRRTRTYGFSWTTDIEVARSFMHRAASYSGGSVLLSTRTRSAVICDLTPVLPRSVEAEVIVDRRLLGLVQVIERTSSRQ